LLICIEHFCTLSPRSKQYIRYLCIGAFLFFFGLRGFIGWDWSNYYLVFRDTPSLFDAEFPKYLSESFIEKGFITYLAAVKQIWPNYHFFVFVSSLIDVLILNIFLKRYIPRYALGFLVFILMGGFIQETDLMRNTKSIFLFLLSLRYVKERKPVKYFALNILGMMFHLSSVIYLPVYFLLNRKIPRYAFVIIFILGNLIFLARIEYIKPIVFFLTQIIGGKFSYLARVYLESPQYAAAYGISIGYLERLGTSLLLIIFYDRIMNASRYSVIFINAFIIYFVLFFYFAEASVIAARLGQLFIFSYWFIWPAFADSFKVWGYKNIYLAGLCMYALLKMYVLPNSILYRYDNALLGATPFEDRIQIFNRYSERLQSN